MILYESDEQLRIQKFFQSQTKYLRSRKPVSLLPPSIILLEASRTTSVIKAVFSNPFLEKPTGKWHSTKKVLKNSKQTKKKGLKNKPNNQSLFLPDKYYISFNILFSGTQVLRGTTSSLQSLYQSCQAELKGPFPSLCCHGMFNIKLLFWLLL